MVDIFKLQTHFKVFVIGSPPLLPFLNVFWGHYSLPV